MKKNLILGEELSKLIGSNMSAMKSLRDQALVLRQQLKGLEKALENEHHATVEAIKEEIARTQVDVNSLLNGAYTEFWDLQIELTPFGLSKQENDKLVGSQRERISKTYANF